MGSSPIETFSCVCGKRYKWKPEIAGKKLRCKCGSVVNVPAPPPPEEENDSLDLVDDDLGEGIAAPPPRRPVFATPTPTPKSRTVTRTADTTEPKSGGFALKNLTDPVRDLYVPAALLIIGLVGIIVWTLIQPHASAFGMAMFALFTGLQTLVKMAAITALALVLAPLVGLGFGLLPTAILKFAAIVVFSDASLLWLEEILRSTGGISRNGTTVYQFIIAGLGCMIVVIAATSYYLFRMDMEETATFALPMGSVSFGIGFVLERLAVVMLATIVATQIAVPGPQVGVGRPPVGPRPNSSIFPMTPPPPPPAPTPPAPGVDMTPVQIVPTPIDRTIGMMVNRPTSLIPDARLWQRKKGLTSQRISHLIDQMFDSGAPHAYMELRFAAKGTAGEPIVPARLIVELPKTVGQRQACFDIVNTYLTDNQITPPATQPATEQFLVIELRY